MKFLFNWGDVGYPFFLLFEKNDGKNIDWRQKEMVGKMHKMIKQLLTQITWKKDFPMIKKRTLMEKQGKSLFCRMLKVSKADPDVCYENQDWKKVVQSSGCTETATGNALQKKLFLNISQHSQENASVEVSF